MKRILFFSIVILAFTTTIKAQTAVDKIFNKYAGKDGYTTVVINSFMFKMLSNIETGDPEYEQFKKATQGIESIRILTQDGKESRKFAKELLDILPRNEYKELMEVKEANEEVVFLARQDGDKISEFLLIVSSDTDDDALIAINGNIDLETISSLASGMQLPAMKSLEDFDDKK